MSRMMIGCIIAALAAAIAVNGCSSSVKTALQMQPGQTASYEVSTTMIKDYKFEQPGLKKSDHNQTSTTITMMFDQTIAEVAADGVATADIVVKGIRCKNVNKSETRYEFDSADAKYQADSANTLIGQSYRIAISPAGQVQVVDANAVRSAALSGEAVNLAAKLFSDKSIIERHQVPLPDEAKALSAKQSWTKVVPSPPGLLAPKTFQKVYTVKEAGNDKLVVEMDAKEDLAKKTESGDGASMGMFARMFDSQDQYTGKLVLNPADGSVELSEETLVSTYTASEMPQGAAADALPDTLMMSLTNSISLKKIK